MFDCFACGACCREGFDVVPLSADDDATARAYPSLVATDARGDRSLRRVPSEVGERTRCVALIGDPAAAAPCFSCAIYADRPSACRDLEIGSEACRFARRRVGLDG